MPNPSPKRLDLQQVHQTLQHKKAPNKIPLPEGQLFYYANNDFKPECCKHSSISGTGGCACETEEQVKFLESRGGNKTYDIKEL